VGGCKFIVVTARSLFCVIRYVSVVLFLIFSLFVVAYVFEELASLQMCFSLCSCSCKGHYRHHVFSFFIILIQKILL